MDSGNFLIYLKLMGLVDDGEDADVEEDEYFTYTVPKFRAVNPGTKFQFIPGVY